MCGERGGRRRPRHGGRLLGRQGWRVADAWACAACTAFWSLRLECAGRWAGKNRGGTPQEPKPGKLVCWCAHELAHSEATVNKQFVRAQDLGLNRAYRGHLWWQQFPANTAPARKNQAGQPSQESGKANHRQADKRSKATRRMGASRPAGNLAACRADARGCTPPCDERW